MLGFLIVCWALGPGDLDAELSRLDGQRVHRAAAPAGYVIDDIAGEGPPRVGVVSRRGRTLWLVEASGEAVELSGPLATPRIAGPGYKVWVLGGVDPAGRLRARRLGVLRPPRR